MADERDPARSPQPPATPGGRRVRAARLRRRAVPLAAGALLAGLVVAALAVPGRGRGPGWTDDPPPQYPGPRPAALALAAFDSCTALRDGLRAHAAATVGPYGFPWLQGGVAYSAGVAGAGAGARAEGDATGSAVPAAAAPDHSTTNVHEAGVDEPDLVKTDGRRIVTVAGGDLRVVDAATRRLTGTVRLSGAQGGSARQLLLAGNRALVLLSGATAVGPADGTVTPGGVPVPGGAVVAGERWVLVDLSAGPRVVGTVRTDGQYVDARLVGSRARLVLRSAPTVEIPQSGSDGRDQLARARAAVRTAPLSAWLPRYDVTVDGRTRSATVPCTAVSHPQQYTASSMLTVYTVDLTGDPADLADLAPLSIAADGDTVYGTSQSLYVASNPDWWGCCAAYAEAPAGGPVTDVGPGGPVLPARPAETTQIHRFDITGPGRPRYLGSGSVPGRLLDQYSLSDYDGHLRVVTSRTATATADSALFVLDADTLRVTGKVGGLGRGERLYAVRLLGPQGYVVTFRNTDPLYVLDLRDPARPRVTGELKITGYSTYLHPVGDGRLLGVGQEASLQGRVAGMQLSLFDVTDPAAPTRVDRLVRPQDVGEQQLDPHAFLYWPATSTAVVPVDAWEGPDVGKALVLRVTSDGLRTVGLVGHPAASPDDRYRSAIERSLVIGDTLWTVSERGIQAVDLSSLAGRAWIPFA